MIRRIFQKMDLEITPLVAYGLVVIFLILGVVSFGRFSDRIINMEARAQSAKSELAVLSDVQATDVWEKRFEHSRHLRQQFEAKILTGATGGVLAAEIQQSLRKVTNDFGLDNVRIQVNSESEDVNGIAVILFTFSGRADDWHVMLDVLFGLAKSNMHIIIYDMQYTMRESQRNGSHFELSGMVPVKIVVATEKTNASPQPTKIDEGIK